MKRALATAWHDNTRPFRLPVQVHADGYERYDRSVEVRLDFAQALHAIGREGEFGADSIHVLEVDTRGAVLDDHVPFQFDVGPGDSAAAACAETMSKGTLVLMLQGTTSAGATRLFHVHFDLAGGSYVPVSIPAQIALADGVQHEGQKSFEIVTQNATYIYHKLGAGFASMIDVDGNDWISYHPSGGSAGNYRGIPNVVHPEGYFHPGNTGCTSRVVSSGPLKLTIYSESSDQQWACKWEVYPYHATLTLLKVGHPYWFLYEGTPGGRLDVENDYCVRSTGQRTPASVSWEGDIPEPEWLYFGAGNTSRVLYLIHHEDDNEIDSYWPMEYNMTVFGFGRQGLDKYMGLVPAHFTVGFAEDGTFEVARRVIDSAFRELDICVGEPETIG